MKIQKPATFAIKICTTNDKSYYEVMEHRGYAGKYRGATHS